MRFARHSCSRDREGAAGLAASVSASRSFRTPAITFEVSDEKRERRWRDAIHACGLANGAGTRGAKPLANFNREPAYLRIVQPWRQFQTLIAPIGRNVRSLAREIDVVFRVDLELLCNFRRQIAELGPDRRELCRPDVGVR
jgi:hypothetical protein